MNDEPYVEAARCLAERLLTAGGTTTPDRLNYGFRMTTARMPDERPPLYCDGHAAGRIAASLYPSAPR